MSGPAFKLRPYQEDAITAVLEARHEGIQRMLVCLPTGAGKTVIFSQIIRILRCPTLVLAHRSELLEQARDKIERTLGEGSEGQPPMKVEIEQGQRRASPDAEVVICSIRSLRTERLERVLSERDVRLVIYDECHHAPALDNKRVLTELRAFDPRWDGVLLGFTATTTRGDRVALETIFEEIVYHRSLSEMIGDGYLTSLRGFRVTTQADLNHLTGGGEDFIVEELAEAVDIRERNALVARTIQELARDRRTLVFCVTVKHAKNLARALNIIGMRAGVVYGDMGTEERVEALASFREGRIQVLTNVGVLTEGFDDPGVSCIAMARPTRSEGMYIQCVGRGTRLAPGKTDCLVLDFVDLSSLSLVTLPSLFGMPWGIDLEGEDVLEAEERLGEIFEHFPTFEVEPGEITLAEIKTRAESFDPVTLHIDPEIKAISRNAWCSLGKAGLVLYFMRKRAVVSEFLIMDSRQPGKKRYRIYLDGDEVAGFSTMEAAVEAVDYELGEMGPRTLASAAPSADWRRDPPTDAQLQRLARLTPPRRANSQDDALRYIAYDRYAPKRRHRARKRSGGKTNANKNSTTNQTRALRTKEKR